MRSLVVSRDARRVGLGERMVEELARRARREGFDTLCAFAHDPAFFVRLGFSIVPHTWVPEKIAHDCSAARCSATAASTRSSWTSTRTTGRSRRAA